MDTHVIAAGLPALGWALHGGMLLRRLATARRDPLTGLHTRAGWTARAERLLAKHPGALVVLVDLDDFKVINDTHGHAAGDTVLTATARRLSDWCGRHGLAARLGGDEFAAIVTHPGRTPGLHALQNALDRPVEHIGGVLPVSASVGHGHREQLPVPTLTDALSAADSAMYAAKGHGRRNTRQAAPGAASTAKSRPLRAPEPLPNPTDPKGTPIMPQRTLRRRICRDCDGFAIAAITTGTRHLDGTRVTLRVPCPACKGTGAAHLVRKQEVTA
ncbi:GGDEF domain-containing protein [Streptomyces olivochromogenes]|uniref:GGDEF domain-containing protein n=1 Tax=Streptomyces olivochromogenes TaxID=1963 RepID=UPI0027E44570|nr:GGDEF domain-containing protein [Streptomyces olivochromogenes]